MTPLHALPIDDVARSLQSDLQHGLSDEEAAHRLRQVGQNRLARADRPDYLQILLSQVADPLVALLLVATAVSAVVGEALDAAVIGAIVALNGTLGFLEELGAEKAVLALRQGVPFSVTVTRVGRERLIPAEELVPGDLMAVREGDQVAADGRVVQGDGLAVEEAPLTGESLPAEKQDLPVADDAPLAERSSMVFRGTSVVRGRGLALVTATGASSEMGRVASLTAGAKPPPTPLQRRMAGIARILAGLGLVITVVLALAMLARGSSAREAFLVGVSVAVAAVPEGLAATVTIALAIGARQMARRGAIVRRLAAVETLGSATLIASDKTGTLTKNSLRVATTSAQPGVPDDQLLLAGALASTARLIVEDDGSPRGVGDPVDAALLVAASERGIATQEARQRLPVIKEIPFDSERRRLTVLYEDAPGIRLFTKGAPEAILPRSTCSVDERRRLTERVEEWAGNGLRVLAIAERSLPSKADLERDDLESELVVLGLVALHDPLRETTEPAVAEARAAGVRVEMLTGDHPATAQAIGRTLGLSADAVHARFTPEEKLRLVERRQGEGEVVAVTGDGINDAPALRRADVGVAMGRGGTEAAREAADLVLTDDDFATIVLAIREGRAITDNVRKFVAFLLSANFGEVLLFTVSILAGLGVPMTVIQILLVNVLTDGLPAVALARDPASPATMRRPPDRRAHLFGRLDWAALGGVGMLVGLASLAAYLIGAGGATAQTRAFATIGLAELLLVFSIRSPREHAWRMPTNRYLLASVASSVAILAVLLFVPTVAEGLDIVRPGSADIPVILGFALLPALVVEGFKSLAYRSRIQLGQRR
jgi:P-type Ca2+ transporter type 2C